MMGKSWQVLPMFCVIPTDNEITVRIFPMRVRILSGLILEAIFLDMKYASIFKKYNSYERKMLPFSRAGLFELLQMGLVLQEHFQARFQDRRVHLHPRHIDPEGVTGRVVLLGDPPLSGHPP